MDYLCSHQMVYLYLCSHQHTSARTHSLLRTRTHNIHTHARTHTPVLTRRRSPEPRSRCESPRILGTSDSYQSSRNRRGEAHTSTCQNCADFMRSKVELIDFRTLQGRQSGQLQRGFYLPGPGLLSGHTSGWQQLRQYALASVLFCSMYCNSTRAQI